MKKLVLGIVAHVDAGKTSLSEAMLYLTGTIKKQGRVDRGDAFLDTFSLERERGITIFSKQAEFKTDKFEVTLLDTPGHSDFSSETERVFSVLDVAILVISGTDGVQSHTETLWRLLEKYSVPTFVFVNKTDLAGFDKSAIEENLRKRFGDGFFDVSSLGTSETDEAVALCSEEVLESYMNTGAVSEDDIKKMFSRREVFPCTFGSALKNEGVDRLLDTIDRYTPDKDRGEAFSARVFKIVNDSSLGRLTYIKLTGGSLSARDEIVYTDASGEEIAEKVAQIRVYNGAKSMQLKEISAGCVCALSGLSRTYPGQGLGAEASDMLPTLESVLSYRVCLPPDADARSVYEKFLILADEDPALHVEWDSSISEIRLRLMGKVQTEILKSTVLDRFGIDISFDDGRVLYKETISEPVEGVGHYEPLRHYSEVHLLIEPLPSGSGIEIASDCSEDELDRNWQNLILTHLSEKQHLGVLTGSPITDIRLTLKAGKAHLKHTEGGDFRQSTYRAVRQGLMSAKSVLLEPYYEFTLTVPTEQTGRAINDIRLFGGEFSSPEALGDMSVLRGRAPAASLRNYMLDVLTYTRGRGSLNLTPCGYFPCRDSEKVIAEIGYEPEKDLENTPDSVFCAHGAGFNVKWNKVPEYMHLPSIFDTRAGINMNKAFQKDVSIDEKELESIMEREFGPIKRPVYSDVKFREPTLPDTVSVKKEYLIIDGYNVIFAWDELRTIAEKDLNAARDKLIDILINFKNFKDAELILVFDGYKLKANPGEKFDMSGIHIVYTREGETGDMFIEKLVTEIGKNYSVKIVTSDNLIRLTAIRAGVLRISSEQFYEDVDEINVRISEILKRQATKMPDKNEFSLRLTLFDQA